MKGHLSLSTLESPSFKTVVPDSLLDIICLHSDNKRKDSDIMTPIFSFFCGSFIAFDF